MYKLPFHLKLTNLSYNITNIYDGSETSWNIFGTKPLACWHQTELQNFAPRGLKISIKTNNRNLQSLGQTFSNKAYRRNKETIFRTISSTFWEKKFLKGFGHAAHILCWFNKPTVVKFVPRKGFGSAACVYRDR